MDQAIRPKIQGKPRILVAPLDWGLGHTTRCIPLVHELIRNNCEVFLAGNQRQAALLSSEFPGLTQLHLEGYNVRYASTATGLYGAILLQVPSLLRSISQEHEWLRELHQQYHFDAVISDNRYGLHHQDIPSIFITHQLQIMSGLGKWTNTLLRKKNYSYINKFTECWVPDVPGSEGLAGALSHPPSLPKIPVHYIGLLSRFNKTSVDNATNHLLIICSGPEPQRTHFENRIIKELEEFKGTATLVRGLPGEENTLHLPRQIRVFNHLPADPLINEVARAEFIISRSGYSTIMDLAALRKKSILIPTPGQTEQEYLGKHLLQKKFAVVAKQNNFCLKDTLDAARQMSFLFPENDNGALLKGIVKRFLGEVVR